MPEHGEQHERIIKSMGAAVFLVLFGSLTIVISNPLVKTATAVGILLGGIGIGAFGAALYIKEVADVE